MDSGHSELKRRLVSPEQLHTLLEFMKEHPELARGLSRGRRGKLMTVKVWNACANKLNSIKDGAVKDGKGWSKYWCDWKYRVRRHALEIKVSRDTNKIPPEGITALAPIEETIMAIIGDSSIEGVVIKSDPLGPEDEDSNEAEAEAEADDNDLPNNQHCETRSKGVKRQRVTMESPKSHDDQDNEDSGSPPEQKARVDVAEESDFDEDDNTAQFLRLEKMQLENAKKIQESICQISLEICKLTDIMGEIRDVLVRFSSLKLASDSRNGFLNSYY